MIRFGKEEKLNLYEHVKKIEEDCMMYGGYIWFGYFFFCFDFSHFSIKNVKHFEEFNYIIYIFCPAHKLYCCEIMIENLKVKKK